MLLLSLSLKAGQNLSKEQWWQCTKLVGKKKCGSSDHFKVDRVAGSSGTVGAEQREGKLSVNRRASGNTESRSQKNWINCTKRTNQLINNILHILKLIFILVAHSGALARLRPKDQTLKVLLDLLSSACLDFSAQLGTCITISRN